jgi:hypothetical protein
MAVMEDQEAALEGIGILIVGIPGVLEHRQTQMD